MVFTTRRIPYGKRLYTLVSNLPLSVGGWSESGTAFYFESRQRFNEYISNDSTFGQPASLRRMLVMYGFQSGTTATGKLVFMHNNFRRDKRGLGHLSKDMKSTHTKKQFEKALLDIDQLEVVDYLDFFGAEDTTFDMAIDPDLDWDNIFSDHYGGEPPATPSLGDGVYEKVSEVLAGWIPTEVGVYD